MAKRKHRGGRKRKALPRTPTGHLSVSRERRTIERQREEHETRQSLGELRDGRARGLGLTREQADHPLSESVAGRLALRGVLSFTQAEAIDEYAKLVRRAAVVMRAPAGPRCSLSLSHGGDSVDDPETYAKVMRCYNDAFGVVRDVGNRACRAINIIVRDICDLPMSERDSARAGATALARHFGFDEARAA